jgi:hypothetical protein
MILLLNGPYWYRGIEAFLGIIVVLISLAIAALSYKSYKLAGEKKYSYFSISFLLISLAFAFYSLINALLTTHISTTLTNLLSGFDYGFLIHMMLTFLAYTLLIIVTLKVEERKTGLLIFSLMMLLALFSYQYYIKFHLVSFILLFFLAYQFYTNYKEKKSANSFLVFISFYLLACSEILFLAMVYFSPLFFVAADIIQLIGFILLFIMFLRINYGREKRETGHN